MCVRVSVRDKGDLGQTRQPIEFIFGTYLPLNNSNPTPKGRPLLPRGGVMESEILGSMGKYRPTLAIAIKFGTSIPLEKETCLPNSSPIALRTWELWGPKVPRAQFWQTVLIAAKRFGGSRSFLAGTYPWTTATPPQRGSYGARNFG